MKYHKTYRLDRLWHQLLKPVGAHPRTLDFLATELELQGLIEVYATQTGARFRDLAGIMDGPDKETKKQIYRLVGLAKRGIK